MKKAILLLAMIFFTSGLILLRNADADTVLIKQQVQLDELIQETEELKKQEPESTDSVQTEEQTEGLTEQELENDITIQAGTESASCITFLRLSLEEQNVYAEILASLLGLENETTLSTKDTSLIDKAFRCVMLDHPEIFYVDGYKYTEYSNGDVLKKIVFAGNYIYDKEEILTRREKIEEAAGEIIAGVPDTTDEYEKVKYVYETIVQNTEYDMTAADNQNICSVFLYGRSVCQGYAKSIQYLLREMGMDCSLVIGTVRGGDGHAWNLVSVNDNWYYLDATWGDAFYLFGEGEQAQKQKAATVNYDYLCVTTQQVELTHTIDMPVAMPICNTLVDNYYVREGLYFEQYDEIRIQEIFASAMAEEKETLTLKCADSSVYESVRTELLTNQKIFNFLQTEDGFIAYTDNKEQCSITFWL